MLREREAEMLEVVTSPTQPFQERLNILDKVASDFRLGLLVNRRKFLEVAVCDIYRENDRLSLPIRAHAYELLWSEEMAKSYPSRLYGEEWRDLLYKSNLVVAVFYHATSEP